MLASVALTPSSSKELPFALDVEENVLVERVTVFRSGDVMFLGLGFDKADTGVERSETFDSPMELSRFD